MAIYLYRLIVIQLSSNSNDIITSSVSFSNMCCDIHLWNRSHLPRLWQVKGIQQGGTASADTQTVDIPGTSSRHFHVCTWTPQITCQSYNQVNQTYLKIYPNRWTIRPLQIHPMSSNFILYTYAFISSLVVKVTQSECSHVTSKVPLAKKEAAGAAALAALTRGKKTIAIGVLTGFKFKDVKGGNKISWKKSKKKMKYR